MKAPDIRTAFLMVPPTGKVIREDRCQTPIQGLHTVALRPPMDLLYMAASLERQGVKCTLFDYPGEGQSWERLEEDLRRLRPDLLVLSITTPTLDRDLRAAQLAKVVRPDTVVVVKGAHFWRDQPSILKQYPMIDVVMRGEYEETIADLVTQADWEKVTGIVYRRNGQISSTGKRPYLQELDRLPYPARHLANNALYIRPDTGELQTTIVTNRGCPEKCIFCLAPRVAGRENRVRSIPNILGELENCINQHGIRNFLFRSDTFTLDPDWVIELCQGIDRAGLKIKWSCNSRVDTLNGEVLRAMREAGCWLISFGVESGSQEILDLLRKNITKDQVRQAINLCKVEGVKTSIYFLIGTPWESEQTFRETLEFAKLLEPDFVEFFYAYPFEGTEMYLVAAHEGLIAKGEFPISAYSRPAMPTKYLSLERLEEMRSEALREYYLRWPVISRTIRNVKSPKVLVNYAKMGFQQLADILT
ncbi:MAG: radical SAM protein [Candidatus Omnitrophica bacterium]|nr:tRNA-2-methylthio-N(6)-dimethylallyladenosine synthase [bacterium]NUN95179.1 radical SAM protein [Candidatus Omnitrophota bacterium]